MVQGWPEFLKHKPQDRVLFLCCNPYTHLFPAAGSQGNFVKRCLSTLAQRPSDLRHMQPPTLSGSVSLSPQEPVGGK